jgi:hypothetical protein
MAYFVKVQPLLVGIAVIAGLHSLPPRVQASLIFYGLDLSAGPAGAHPNSDAARASFLAHLEPGSIGVENFESVALGAFPSGTRSITFSSTAVTGVITDLTVGPTANAPEIRNFPVAPHWFPISGTTYFFTETVEGAPFFDLTLSAPQTAFGFYGTSFAITTMCQEVLLHQFTSPSTAALPSMWSMSTQASSLPVL